MLSKGEIETCKEEARNYIEFMETAGDNAGWTRGLMWYIDNLERKLKELRKGQQSLMQSRKKWKNRYYKMKKANKKLELENKDLQKSVDQIYDDYQDIGKMYFDLDEKRQKLIELLEKKNEEDRQHVQHYEEMYRNTTEEFYKKSYKRTIDMANARRETRKEILSILK